MSASYGMTARGKQIARVISAAVLLAAWALTIDGNFIRQRVQIDPNRANEVARMFDASWQAARIDASDRVPLQGWLITPSLANGRAVVFVHGRGGTRQSMLGRAGPDGYAIASKRTRCSETLTNSQVIGWASLNKPRG